MIEFNVEILGKIEMVILYHRWDVDNYITDWNTIDESSIGKYIMFDDGSEMITKIVGYSKGAVRTECGVFRKGDLIHLCNPKAKNTSYSGMYGRSEHLLVRQLGKQEQALITRHIGGEKLRVMTNRIIEGARLRMENELIKQGMTPEEATSIIIDIARKSGNKQLDAVRDIFCMMGIDTKVPMEDDKKKINSGGAFSNIDEANVTSESPDSGVDDVLNILGGK